MADFAPIMTSPKFGLLRLRTLVRLRWLAVIGQTAATFTVHFGLGFSLPVSACLALIAVSAWLNVFLSLQWPGSQRISTRAAGLLLAYDVLQLAGLLYLTGGLENPFTLLFLVPVTVSATSLPLVWTTALGLLSMAAASVLAIYHLPLPWKANSSFGLPSIYLAGEWAAIVCATIFSAIYARRIAEEARQMSSALQATEMVLAREQRLSALDGLAAAAAHELGTPLATIALVAKELKHGMPNSPEHGEDIDLLISQTARCREILTRLADPEQISDDLYQQVGLEAMLEDLVAPLRGPDIHIKISTGPADDKVLSGMPVFRRNPAIIYGLSNLLENAVDFASAQVTVVARWTADVINLSVSDDGPGFDETIFDRLGDPFVTTRPGYGDTTTLDESGHEGMGLGLFIAKTLLERSGAQVRLANRKFPLKGANVTIQWSRSAVDVGKSA